MTERTKQSAKPRNKTKGQPAMPTFGSCTDIGCFRDHNEDSLCVVPPLFVVADGMGGHAAGEVASEIAVKTVADRAPRTANARELGDAVASANRAILRAAALGQGRKGMGTTCTAAILDGTHLAIAHVGDSRAYLLHNGQLQQITRDHSLVAELVAAGEITAEEARVHPQRSVITRALGSFTDMEADTYELEVEPGDRLMLCTDGLYSMVQDNVIQTIMSRTRNPQHAAALLTEEALDMGGHDNVTVIVVDVTGEAAAPKREVRKSRIMVGIIAVILLAAIGGTAYGVHSWSHNSAYLVDEGGHVAIYQGLPEKVLWCDYRELVRVTDVPTDKLNGGLATRLKEEYVRCDDLETAEKLVAGYQADVEAALKAEAEAKAKAEAEKKAKQDASKKSASAKKSSKAKGKNS